MAEPQPHERADAPVVAFWRDGGAPDNRGATRRHDDQTPVPRTSGQPICAVVTEERGLERVRAFARRWRALRFHREEKRRPWLAAHDLCGPTCTGLTSRCLRAMIREGFLAPTSPTSPVAPTALVTPTALVAPTAPMRQIQR